jgi:hypothetical protein
MFLHHEEKGYTPFRKMKRRLQQNVTRTFPLFSGENPLSGRFPFTDMPSTNLFQEEKDHFRRENPSTNKRNY